MEAETELSVFTIKKSEILIYKYRFFSIDFAKNRYFLSKYKMMGKMHQNDQDTQ